MSTAGEVLEWSGYALASDCALPAVAFAVYTFSNLAPRAHKVIYTCGCVWMSVLLIMSLYLISIMSGTRANLRTIRVNEKPLFHSSGEPK